MTTSDGDAEHRAAERLELAWRAKRTMQRYAGYFAVLCWVIVLAPLLITAPRDEFRPEAVRFLLVFSVLALLFTLGIALLRTSPRFWGLVLCILMGPPVAAICVAQPLWWFGGFPNPVIDSYRLLREVPHLIRMWPDLPQARRWL